MSNKLPKANSKNAIALVRKATQILLIVCFLALAGLVLLLISYQSSHSLSIGGHTFRVSYADTPSQQEKGLGGQLHLANNRGMLFRFSDSGVQCFWMKNMHFPLDIAWLDSDKKIVYIESNVSPLSYPNSFCPPVQARYVLEVNAQDLEQLHTQTGDSISF